MPSEIDLLRSLDDQPRTPSTVDVRRAIAAGRRRRTRRVVGYAGAAAVTAIALAGASLAGGLVSGEAAPRTGASGPPVDTVPAGPTPPTSCELERLPLPDREPMALVTGANPTAEYIVGRTYPRSGGYQAVIWHGGTVKKVMLPGDLEESLTDVNSTGTAVGWSYSAKGQEPYVYQGGKVSKLPGVERGFANAISDTGAIVGVDEEIDAPVLWSSPTAQPKRLPLPAGTPGGSAAAIDEDGTVVGAAGDQAYVWFADGTHRPLPMPDLDGKPAAMARAASVRDGWVTGVANNGVGRKGENPKAEGAQRVVVAAVRWNLRTGAVEVLDGAQNAGNATNAHGWQAGTDGQGHAVFIAEGKTLVLPAVPGQKLAPLANIATTLSDDGRTIGGQSDDATGTIQAVVWRCH